MRCRSGVVITPPKRDDPTLCFGTTYGSSAAKRLRSTPDNVSNANSDRLTCQRAEQMPKARHPVVLSLAAFILLLVCANFGAAVLHLRDCLLLILQFCCTYSRQKNKCHSC